MTLFYGRVGMRRALLGLSGLMMVAACASKLDIGSGGSTSSGQSGASTTGQSQGSSGTTSTSGGTTTSGVTGGATSTSSSGSGGSTTGGGCLGGGNPCAQQGAPCCAGLYCPVGVPGAVCAVADQIDGGECKTSGWPFTQCAILGSCVCADGTSHQYGCGGGTTPPTCPAACCPYGGVATGPCDSSCSSACQYHCVGGVYQCANPPAACDANLTCDCFLDAGSCPGGSGVIGQGFRFCYEDGGAPVFSCVEGC